MNTSMRTSKNLLKRAALFIIFLTVVTGASTCLRADDGECAGGTVTLPFTDVGGSIFFCAIAEAYFSGLTNGTSPTTYSPSVSVPRDQMAAFITRTLDQSLRRRSDRAALDQFSTPQTAADVQLTTVGDNPKLVKSDGADLWVANSGSGTVSRVRASDGKLLETWTGALGATGILVAMGRIFVTGHSPSPGKLYMINPALPPGAVTQVATTANGPSDMAFDGEKIWTVNSTFSISIITPGPTLPWSVTNVNAGIYAPSGIVFDGKNIWITDWEASGPGTLKKLDANGAVVQTISLALYPSRPAFDGTNIWVPNRLSSTVSVVRASTGTVIATLPYGAGDPRTAAFDGERILITSNSSSTVALWKATDLTSLGSFSMGENTLPEGACSDGQHFWVTLSNTDKLARF